ncbi:NAD(P)H-dependent glycerol-3-phosphate dehydrogenase [Candidatus Omnitrophota bacterium]
MIKKIAVLGDGGWGTTLAIHLSKKGFSVSLWGAFPRYVSYLRKKRINKKFLPGMLIPQSVVINSDLQKVVADADLIILAVPSQFLRSVLLQLKRCNVSDKLFLSVSKGIENSTLLCMHQVIRDVLGKVQLAVLSGPTIAIEVAQGIPTTAVVASKNAEIARKIQDVLISGRFRIYSHSDVMGVELGGSVKNIIALACGISDGLGFGTNTKAALLSRGLAEMTRLGTAMGARPHTFSGLSGLGDLVTTCISQFSRNRCVGEQIGRGKSLKAILRKMEMVAEGIATAQSAYRLSIKHKIDMPITKEIYLVLYKDKKPKIAVNDLMTRSRKREFH